jgi:RNA polymerase sigma factor (sigma-70 family)
VTNDEFTTYYEQFSRSIKAIARKISGTNETLFDDLVQVGRIALWKFDTTKVQTNLTGCVNRHLRNRMIDYIRAEGGRSRNTSLDDPFGPALDQLYMDENGHITEARHDRWRGLEREYHSPDDLVEWEPSDG